LDGYGDARPRQAEIAGNIARRDLEGFDDARCRKRAHHLFERNVDGDRHYLQAFAG
jgi:hypothetical protein